jgi:hypothetical protein
MIKENIFMDRDDVRKWKGTLGILELHMAKVIILIISRICLNQLLFEVPGSKLDKNIVFRFLGTLLG